MCYNGQELMDASGMLTLAGVQQRMATWKFCNGHARMAVLMEKKFVAGVVFVVVFSGNFYYKQTASYSHSQLVNIARIARII